MSFDALLGVTKYETEKCEPSAAGGGGSGKKEFGSNKNMPMPDFIRSTEQERMQDLPADAFERWSDAVLQTTVKMDGSSMTV